MKLPLSESKVGADSSPIAVEDDCDKPTHPLEFIPIFRRWPRGFLRNAIYTVIFSSGIGIILVLLSMTSHKYESGAEFFESLGANLVLANVIGFTFHIVYNALAPLLRRITQLPLWGIIVSYTVLGCVIVQMGAFAASWIPGFEEIRVWMQNAQWYFTALVISFLVSVTMSLAWRAQIDALERAATTAKERERLQIAERAAVEANLRALQAQIEPHFLFNTLANVVSLIEPAPQKARLMLQDFIEYLRASLASTRARQSTLGREAELMRAFLRLIQIRMGDRLRFRVEIPEALERAAFPPMLLQPLIENAIKHGLEPTIQGGEVVVRAAAQPNAIEITVEDSGRGFQGDVQSGLGLANVRERLAGLYGPTASFVIENRSPPPGTRITLRVPAAEMAVEEATA
jgi:signal transduction histidine kinase